MFLHIYLHIYTHTYTHGCLSTDKPTNIHTHLHTGSTDSCISNTEILIVIERKTHDCLSTYIHKIYQHKYNNIRHTLIHAYSSCMSAYIHNSSIIKISIFMEFQFPDFWISCIIGISIFL